MIVAFENPKLPKNDAATTVVRKMLRDSTYKAIRGPVLLANSDDLYFWFFTASRSQTVLKSVSLKIQYKSIHQ